MAKSDSMLAIVWLLKARGRMTAQELAEVLEISVRSVYRHVDSLCASGVPILALAGHDGGYRLPESYQNAPLFFTTEERTALTHSALFAGQAGYPFTEALSNALQKIDYYSSKGKSDDLARHIAGINVLTNVDHSHYADALADVERAIVNRRTVGITYHTAKTDLAQMRSINPYGLVHWRDRWYVVAYCHLRREIRTFRVDRIVDLQVTDDVFESPAEFNAIEFFSAAQMMQTRDTDKVLRTVLVGDSDSLDDLEKHWFLGTRLVERKPAEATFLIEEQTLVQYVPHILLAFGTTISVIEPDSLKRSMVDLIQNLAIHHGGPIH